MFTYHMPTKVFAGEEAVLKNAEALLLGKRALIVTGQHSAKKSGALSDVTSILEAHAIPYTVFDEIENNPTIETCVRGGAVAAAFGADFLIGIGGGSPLDATKAIAVYAVNPPQDGSDFTVFDIFSGKFPHSPLPMAAIPTTAGTGSEVTPYSILTLHSEKNKRSFSSPSVFYKTAFLDGRYTVGLPLQIARNTAVDAISHLVEGFTDKKASPGSDYIALEGLRVMAPYLSKLREGGLSIEACTSLLWAATLGGMVISQTGTTIVHSMGYPLTYYKNIPHGMANGFLLGEYMRRTALVLPDKIDACLLSLGFSVIDTFCAWLRAVLPKTETFSEAELEAWTETSIKAKNVQVCPFPVSRETEAEIYKAALL